MSKDNQLYPYEISDDLQLCYFIREIFRRSEIDEEEDISWDDSIFGYDSTRIAFDLLKRIRLHCSGHVLSIIEVPFYDDRYYRSSYSMYYYGKHFKHPNWCSRIFLFDGGLLHNCENDSSCEAESEAFFYESALIGSIVIKPIVGMEIGRTIINPKYIYGDNKNYQIRTAYYSETMNGLRMHVYGFPYSMQDGETVTCAETTILNITDYFSQRYQTYRVVFPDEISDITHANSYDRNLPSKGLSYQKVSKIFMEVGFYPRLYATKYERERMLEILYSYVSSGIPVAMGINQDIKGAVGHSIVVIGTAETPFQSSAGQPITIDDLIVERIPNAAMKSTVFISVLGNTKRRYFIMDDGRAPYTIGEISQAMDWRYGLDGDALKITLKYGNNPYDCYDNRYSRPWEEDIDSHKMDEYEVNFLTVPLSKEMAMEAEDAIRCFKNLLGGTGQKKGIGYTTYIYNMLNRGNPIDEILFAGENEGNPLILRIFLCAARSLKRFRYESMCQSGYKDSPWLNTYRSIHLPRYVWVCEIYTLKSLNREKPICLGEIVLDATASNSHLSDLSNVIMINYPGKMAYRHPKDDENALIKMLEEEEKIIANEKYEKNDKWLTLVPFQFDDERTKTQNI